MNRKTFSVRKLVEEVNRRNRESTCSKEVRDGWNSLLETVLHSAGNCYAGFRYLGASEVPDKHLPGIVEIGGDPGEIPVQYPGGHFKFPDESRRQYFLRTENRRTR